MKQELLRLSADQFVALILDNEVTVGEFVTTPPLSWTRLIQRNGIFQIAEGYPTNLTAAQAKFEMRNWDEVSLPAIMRGLEGLDDSADYVLFGNNAGQGLPLAQSFSVDSVRNRAAIIYANSLPEKSAYKSSTTEPSFAGVRRSLDCWSWQRTKAVRLLSALSIRFNTTSTTTTIPEQSEIQDRETSGNL